MKRWVWLCVGLVVGAASGATPSDFAWRYPVMENTVAARLYRVEIPVDLYGRAEQFPRDVRLFDETGRQWPLYVEPPPGPGAAQTIKADVINRAWVEEPDRYLRVDVRMAEGATRPRHNQVVLHTTGAEFIRRVEVFGSEKQTEWALLGKGYLLNGREPRPIAEDTIHYAESDYPWLQVRVYPNARQALETFEVGMIEARWFTRQDAARRVLPHELAETPREDWLATAQTLVLDLGHERVPADAVRLSGRGEYVRRVVVASRNRDDEPWRHAGVGDVHRIGESLKDEVAIRAAARYLKVDVYHDDDPPLTIERIDVLAARPYLVFEAQHGGPAALYVGSATVEGAQYDLARRSEGRDAAVWPEVTLGEAEANPAYRATGYGRWGRVLAVAAVGVASLAVIAVMVGMFRRMGATAG